MSNVKANVLKLYDEVDSKKKYEVRVSGSNVFMDYFTEAASGLPADRTFHPIAFTKMNLDGLGDVRIYANETRTKAENNETGLAVELLARAAADTVLQQNIDDEESRAVAAETANAALVGTEATRAQAKEAQIEATHNAYVASNDAALASEISRAQAAESKNASDIKTNATAITNESTRAQNAESVLQQNIDDEETARLAGISAVQDSVNEEKTRAQASEASLQSQISNLLSNTDAVALNSLAEIVAAYGNADNALDARISQLEQQVAALLSFHT